MQINVTFNSLAELQAFAAWAHSRDELPAATTVRDIRVTDTRPVTAEGAIIPPDGPQDAQEPASAGAGEPPSTDPVPESPPKRKRRTKAEITAEAAAAQAQAAERESGYNPLDNFVVEPEPQDAGPTDGPAQDDFPAELIALAGTIDGTDKLAHMNEGRDFISKHGFPKYNETFALADVPANIAAHTTEQAAMHRAALQWLAARGGAK